ncbi:16S rRNA (uracil(1498)-N(3))-methyltransferase [Hydrogenophaga bisanensis]|uniref:Ribosomal RNA small subunit methyltransferase E n=1 Tax=Hydrogenophaga bisanensis TaxID=439611 RepID=A0ABW2RB52_9BURK
MPRFHCPVPLSPGAQLTLPAGAARHVQVLRLQPGAVITLFNGEGGEWAASILRMGRSDVEVQVQSHDPIEREPVRPVHLAMGMPANERMDWLVEKAAELGVASITPLQTAHSVLRLSGERAQKKSAHWQSVAAAACEQCGGNRVPAVQPVQDLSAWLRTPAQPPALRCVLSLAEGTQPLREALQGVPDDEPVTFLSGPEGGLSAQEDALARAAGFVPVSLGPRTLRAETAALVALAQALGC